LPANVQKISALFFLILIQFKKHGIVDSKKALEIVEKLQERGFRVAEEILMQTIDGFEIIFSSGPSNV
jgi:predicted nucleic acid-binding protein